MLLRSVDEQRADDALSDFLWDVSGFGAGVRQQRMASGNGHVAIN